MHNYSFKNQAINSKIDSISDNTLQFESNLVSNLDMKSFTHSKFKYKRLNRMI